MKIVMMVVLLGATLCAQEPIHVTPERLRGGQNQAPSGKTRIQFKNELQQCRAELEQAKDGWEQSYKAWAELAQASETQSKTSFVPMQLGDGQIIRSEDEMVSAYNRLVIAYNLLVSTHTGLSVPATSASPAIYQATPIPSFHHETLPNTSSFVPSVVPTTPSVTPQWMWNVDENRPGVLLPATPGLPTMPSVDVGYGCWTFVVDVTTGQPASVWMPSCSGN